MKKLLSGAILLVLLSVFPVKAAAEVNISVGIGFPLPPPIVFQAPPSVIVLPDTSSVYVVPYVEVDIFFWNGWWWRPWDGRWYRSRYYDRGWAHYNAVPRFYYDVDPGWRRFYRYNEWYGHRWHHEPIPYQHLHKSWPAWQKQRYWEGRRAWNVQGYKPRALEQKKELRKVRQQQYQLRPEVQRFRQEQQQRQQQAKQQQAKQRQVQTRKAQQPDRRDLRKNEQPGRPGVQQPKPQNQQRVQQPQRQEQRPHQQSQSQKGHKGNDGDNRR